MAYVSNLAVEPSHRRKGIALLLLQRAAKVSSYSPVKQLIIQTATIMFLKRKSAHTKDSSSCQGLYHKKGTI